MTAAQAWAQTPTAPGEPGSVTVTARNRSLDVTWAAPASDGGVAVSAYTVRHKLSSDPDMGASWTEIAHSDTTNLSRTVTGLTEWTSYDVEVSATNSAGEGAWSQTAQGTPDRDIDALRTVENSPRPFGLWSDDTTMWVVSELHNKVFAFSLATGERTGDEEWDLDVGTSLDYASHDHAWGICSDGTTIWVSDDRDDRLYAYEAGDKDRDPDKDIVLTGYTPKGLWCDSSLMRVQTSRHGAIAMTLPGGARDPARDLPPLDPDATAAGIWTDDSTVWSTSALYRRVAARGTDGWPRPGLEIDTGSVHDRGQLDTNGVWSDGTTIWVSDWESGVVYSYPSPDPTDGPPEPWSATASADGSTVTVGFDEALDTNAAPAPERFAVTVGDRRPAAPTAADHTRNDSKSVTLTLAVAPAPGEPVSILYTDLTNDDDDDTSGVVQDASGVDLAPFSAMEVLTLPGEPTNLSVVAQNRSLAVSWDAPSTGRQPASYTARYKKSSAPDELASWTTVENISAVDRSATLANLELWVPYDVEVAAVNPVGTGPAAAAQGTPNRDIAYPPDQLFLLHGLWSDGTTLWATTDAGGLHALTLATGEPDPDKARWLSPDVTTARGICSDGTTVWVSDIVQDRLYAHVSDSGARDPAKDILFDNSVILQDLWCDPTRMLVPDYNSDTVLAFTLPDRQRDPGNDFTDLRAPGLANAKGVSAVWSDGDTVWVSDFAIRKLYAYGLSDQQRRADMDLDAPQARGQSQIMGIWSDGTTVWATEFISTGRRLASYRLPQATDGGPDPWSAAVSEDGSSVTITFSEAVGAQASSAAAAFRVRVGSASAVTPTSAAVVTGDTKSVKLGLATAATAAAGAAVSVSYTDPTSGDDTGAVLQDADGNDAESFSGLVAANRPAVPAAVRATAGDTLLTVDWSVPVAVGGAAVTAYDVRYKLTSATEWTSVTRDDPAARSQTVAGLTNGMQYDVAVRARNRAGWGLWSTTQQQTPATSSTAPGQPRNVTVDRGLSELTVKWDGPAGGNAPLYDVQYREQGVTAWTAVTRRNRALLSETIASLGHGTVYEVQVRAQNTAGAGDWSNAVAQTTVAVPGAPRSVSMSSGNRTLAVAWDEPADDGGGRVTAYKVRYQQRAEPGAENWLDATPRPAPAARTQTLAGLTEWKTYEVQVAAVNGAGTGEWTESALGVAHRHIRSLSDSGNTWGTGIWSDDTTMWVSDDNQDETGTEKIFAYVLDTGARDSDKDIDTLVDAGNTAPSELWSDGDTMWVSNVSRDAALNKVFAYVLDTGARDSDKDIDTLDGLVSSPFGMWSDGTTMWIADSDGLRGHRNQIRAFRLSDGQHQPDKDFDTLYDADVRGPGGIWSDGDTMWVAQLIRGQTDGGVYAFSMDTQQRVPSRDIVTTTTGNANPTAIWSDGTTMWVLRNFDEIDSYELPPATAPPAPPDFRVVSGDGVLTVSWSALGDDGGTAVSSFTVEYRESNAVAWTPVPFDSLTDLSVALTSVNNGTSYDVRVAAVNSVGTGDWAKATSTPSKALDTLDAAGNDNPAGLWSDGLTLWVSDPVDDHIYAYNLRTTRRDPGKDIGSLDNDNLDAVGLWSDDTTLWVLDDRLPKAFAYRLSDGARQDSDDVDAIRYARQSDPYGLWSDGITMWATSRSDTPKLFAYNLSLGPRDPDKDFDTLAAAGVSAARGLWSDGGTMWVGNDSGSSSKIYAFSTDTKQRVPGRDIDAAAAGLTPPGGMWSDGTWLWVAGNRRVHVVELPAATAPQAPSDLVATPRSGSLSVSWSAPGDDGGAAVIDFDVEYMPRTGGSWEPVDHRDLADLSVEIPGLTNGTAYDVRISATNSIGTSAWSSLSATPAVLTPEIPRSAAAVSGDGVLTVDWEAPANVAEAPVDSYSVQYMPRTGGPWVPVDHRGLADLSVEITGLTNGTAYVVQISAISIAGTGPAAAVSATPSKDFDTLAAAGNNHPVSLWSDGTTMWVADAGSAKLFAYYKVSTRRDSGKDIELADENSEPEGIWSDGTTMWVASNDQEATDDKIYAYNLNTARRDSGKDIELADENSEPEGIWSDGTTMWVSDWGARDKIYAYNLNTAQRDSSKDFDTLDPAGIEVSDGITSDGSTMWVAETEIRDPAPNQGTIFAFSSDTKARVPSRDVDITREGGFIRGLWTDGATIWGVAFPQNRLEAFAVPSARSPKAPADLEVSPGDEELSVRWAPPGDDGGAAVTGYDLWHRRRSPQGDWTKTMGVSGLSVTGLSNDVAYDVQVRARNSEGEGPWAQTTGTPRADAVMPGAPRNLAASPGNLSLTATWSPPASDGGATITSYDLWHRRRSPQGDWTKTTGVSGLSVTGLSNDVAYDVQVRARNSVGEGPWAQTTGTPEAPPDVPGAPRNLAASPRDGSLEVTWAAPDDDGGATITSYMVQYRTSPSGDWLTAARSRTTPSEMITELVNDTAYDVQVAAVNGVGRGTFTPSATATPRAQRPGLPLNLRAVPGDGLLSVSWSPPADDGAPEATSYVVRWRPEPEEDAWTTLTRSDPAALTEQITELAAEVEFVVQVAAANGAVQGDWASITSTTSPATRSTIGGSSSGGGVGGGSVGSAPTETDAERAARTFRDVPADAYYASAVAWMIDNAITAGCTQDEFCSAESVTRGQFVVFLWRAAGRPAAGRSGAETFEDVDTGSFADQAIGWAFQAGVTLGCGGGSEDEARRFCPSRPLVRAQIATLLYRYVVADTAQQTPPDNRFVDVDSDSYYASAVAWMVSHGITTGCSADSFCPGDTTSRAQAAAFMHRIASNPDSWGAGGIIRTPAEN